MRINLAMLLVPCLFLALANAQAAERKADPNAERHKDKAVLRLDAHKKHVTALAFSPDGKVLASAGVDGWICLWDVATGKRLQRFEGHDEKPVYGLSYAPDGKLLASAGADYLVRLWDPATAKLVRELKGHKDKVAAVAFSPDGKLLASASYDSSIRLWDPTTGAELRQLKGHKKRVTSLAFSPDSKQLVSGGVTDDPINLPGGSVLVSGWADRLRLWNVNTGEELRNISAKGFLVGFSPDGRMILGAGLIPEIAPDKDNPKRTIFNGESRITLLDAATGDSLHYQVAREGLLIFPGWSHDRLSRRMQPPPRGLWLDERRPTG